MSSYTGTADRPDQAKAIGAVVAVHVALAAAILTGLNVRMVGHAVEVLKTFDIRQPPPPPPPEPPPPPAKKAQKARLEEGAAGKKAEPTPVVAPKPRIPVPSPIPAAPIAGTGNASRSGAANYGTGPGAGGAGNGRGGGYGDFTGYTPARIIRRIPNREYRRISAGRIPQGSASIRFRVEPDGRMSNCRVVRSSGDPYVDSIVCDAAVRNMLFSPARDASGRPIPYEMSYTPTWTPNRW